jgi:hypothetical protein
MHLTHIEKQILETETQGQLISEIDKAWAKFWKSRGFGRELISGYEPHEVRGTNAYNAYGVPPHELDPEDLIMRANSRSKRLHSARSAEQKRAEHRAVNQT